MVRHVILWKLPSELTLAEKREKAEEIKKRLEALNGKIEGLTALEVITAPLSSSTADLMLDSSFVNDAALDAYQIHPLHQEASAYIRSVVSDRMCMDFEA